MSEAAPQKSNTMLYVGIGCAVFFFLGIPIIGILAAIAIPNFVSMQYKTKRSEVPINLKAIKTLQEAYEADFGFYIPAAPYPPAPSQTPQNWNVTSSGGFFTLGWVPMGDVRGSYSVTTTSTDFRAVGVIDVDGDGVYATYVATKSTNPIMPLTSPDVY